jgi:hypothetical protein
VITRFGVAGHSPATGRGHDLATAPLTPGRPDEGTARARAKTRAGPAAAESDTITGAVGRGDWIVVVKRKEAKLTIEPSSTEPEPIAFQYEGGDKVTATVSSPGGWVIAGHD